MGKKRGVELRRKKDSDTKKRRMRERSFNTNKTIKRCLRGGGKPEKSNSYEKSVGDQKASGMIRTVKKKYAKLELGEWGAQPDGTREN